MGNSLRGGNYDVSEGNSYMNIGPTIVFGSTENFLSFLQNYGSVKDQEQLLNTVFQDADRRLTPLMTAIVEGKLDIATVIIEQLKVNLETHQNCYFVDSETGKTYTSVTALFCAAYKGYGDLIRLLAKHNCSVNFVTDNGESPLYIACCKGDFQSVKVLLELKASVTLGAGNYRDVTPIHAAVRIKDPRCAALLFQYGQDNLVNLHTSTLLFSISPAHMAAMYGGLEVFKCVHFYGANLAKRNKLDMTVLMSAAAFGNLEVVKYLVDLKPSDLKSTTSSATSALHLACLFGHTDVVEFLVANGADLNTADIDGANCYDYAKVIGNPRLLEQLKCDSDELQVSSRHKSAIQWLDLINKIAQHYEVKSRVYAVVNFGEFEAMSVFDPLT